MIKEVTASAATPEEAVEAAKAALGAPEGADVNTDIISVEEEKKKVFGLFGGAPAKYTAKAWFEESDFADVENYIKVILESLGIENPVITFDDSDEDLRVTLDCGEDYGSVIGRRGETLDAIQYLTRLVVNKNNEGYRRVAVNVGNYREKRENTLRALARKNASKAKKYGRNIALEPMNPYERRIIHSAIAEIEGVASRSVGEEPYRKVIISSTKPVRRSRPGNDRRGGKPGGNRNDRRGNNRNNRNDRGRRNESVPSERISMDSMKTSFEKDYKRPKADDEINAGLYGKIEF